MFRKILYLFAMSFFASMSTMAGVTVAKGGNNSKPIEITADSLEVLQEDNVAIFSGDVQAKQGDMDIRAEKMTVYYKNKDQKQTSGENKISRVEIDNNVFISTPKETAKGDKGVYEVDHGIISLEGNVTLTSQKNIVKGRKLVYNLKTGQSKIVGGKSDGESASGKKERVRSVFIPGGK